MICNTYLAEKSHNIIKIKFHFKNTGTVKYFPKTKRKHNWGGFLKSSDNSIQRVRAVSLVLDE